MTLPELVLWRELRRRSVGLRFRRQHPVGPYVLDFYCASHALAVEVDGDGHNFANRPASDARRDAWLTEHGIRTLRIPAAEVLRDPEAAVLTMLAQAPFVG